ncbi:hypothetical protein FA95DRAFT_543928 [Auriscalpium vulgare]|uniref:Uncharacterized protein n=1 Tax=Auriscalpium vulgare TaxID=40419 RepID=A0ACB8RF62_9AGAM|nr:hypothetical protein FA95DRAFT_543928 [Auriscalpium vulgare]
MFFSSSSFSLSPPAMSSTCTALLLSSQRVTDAETLTCLSMQGSPNWTVGDGRGRWAVVALPSLLSDALIRTYRSLAHDCTQASMRRRDCNRASLGPKTMPRMARAILWPVRVRARSAARCPEQTARTLAGSGWEIGEVWNGVGVGPDSSRACVRACIALGHRVGC